VRALGIATTVCIALAILSALLAVVLSLPDVARYLRMRRM